ncbi:hypothetical protein M0D69_02880 [Caballeronia sp. SEWSISQ10-4 2]|uniref:hypothetical protein n=1 Tax=Caballeronia sp. SEWSISQ10-4 2 TaxID=2937438 RepID=UPI00264D0635|nr:hypothetical protein [Caballeronia sp. SEWSISQ10-4 2]MDN7176979.1 hypothetical protein [Caballeronia sp. SEWSISQ10-4 2]
MPNEEKSFQELLAQAPEDEEQNQLVLHGAIARSKDPGTFVLKLQSGRSLTLPVDAVRSYKLLARSFGSLFVEVEIAVDKVPSEIANAELNAPVAQMKSPFEKGHLDLSHPALDIWPKGPYPFTDHTFPNQPEFIEGPVGGGYEQGWTGPASGIAGMTPFSLAAPHQVSPEYLAAMMQFALPWNRAIYTLPTGPTGDYHVPKFHLDPQVQRL